MSATIPRPEPLVLLSPGLRPLARRWRRFRRGVRRWASRSDLYPRLEIGAVLLTLVLGWSSYALLTGQSVPASGVAPEMVTALVVANLLPLMTLVVLIARRVAILLANRRRGLAGAHMHVRLVALFAGIAAVPTLLVVIFASLLFQFGVQFWFSDRVKTILDGSNQVAQAYVEENRQRVADDIVAMSSDITNYSRDFGAGTALFARGLQFQVAARNLSEAMVFTRDPRGRRTALAVSGIAPADLAGRLAAIDIGRARTGAAPKTADGAAVGTQQGAANVAARGQDRIEAVLAMADGRFLYVSRKVDPAVLARAARAAGALDEYRSLIERSRVMQLRFNLVLMAVSLITLAVAIWFALALANRMVAPVARLAQAAQRVGDGDLDVRVPQRDGGVDEIGMLTRAFNRMTGQLKAQQAALIGANAQLDSRRQFTEAVLSGVSAGVLSIAGDGSIRAANASAALLLQSAEADLVGASLKTAVPALAALLDEAAARGDASGQVRIVRGPETQTLSVRIAGAGGEGREGGYVLTFDDITAQLADQRRAAWADVARRIAHEIKNPLTPISLAAERLQRKFGRQVTEDAATFATLTGTIVRQVGDLRRMVDEFSDFARLPRPVFAAESLDHIVAQALVLQDVAYPAIDFRVEGSAEPLVCDRQQLGRALTNVVKNAAEAVCARIDRDAAAGLEAAPGVVTVTIDDGAEAVAVTVTDNGCGLPTEGRERLTEPYVTTRARGTGLGLAIVKKIVEDHGGSLELGDAPGGGAMARMRLGRGLAVVAIPFPEAGDSPAPLRMTG